MGEKKGFLFGFIIFMCFFLPAGLDWYVHSVKSDQLLKSATEVQQLVQSEGGYTTTVKGVLDTMRSNGLEVKVTQDKDGAQPFPVSDTKLTVGTKVYLHYHYERRPIFGLRQEARVLETSNKVVINRR